jgi:colanic acid/amylovoran biosynthesis glycosyltransferase
VKTIVLFTGSYPYSKSLEDTFLEPELEVLNDFFKIILVPLSRKGSKSEFIKKLKNIEICEDFIEFNKKDILNVFKMDLIFLSDLKNIKKLAHLKDLVKKFIFYRWVKKNIEQKIENELWSENFIYYTYWFDYATTALVSLKKQYSLKVVTRVHGYDLYEERKDGFIPFRSRDVTGVDKIVTISMQGLRYLKDKYKLKNVYNSYLGVRDLNIKPPINSTNNFKIVSCSLMLSVKRIDMIMNYLSTVSKELKIKVEWCHIGNGSLEDRLLKQKQKKQHKNFKINFIGFLENRKIFEYYNNNSFDYFITLSASEGLPVTLMEACSVGLPIIATSVGGIGEIVENKVNGFLLSKNPTYIEFKQVFFQAIEYKNDSKTYSLLIKNSRKSYEDKFKSEVNHRIFIDLLNKL